MDLVCLLLVALSGSWRLPSVGAADSLVNLDAYQIAAKGILDREIYDFAAQGGWYELTENRNRLALQTITLWPRYLRDVSQIDTNVTVLGKTTSFPIGISPSAFHKAFYPPEGELATARACEKLGNIYAVSYYATTTLEDIAKEAPNCRKWMDLYISENRSATEDVVRRAKKAGFEALVLTVDGVNYGRHFRNDRQGYEITAHYEAANLPPGTARHVDGDPKATWDDVHWITTLTDLPLVVKGVEHPKDAHKAAAEGAAAVYVSNHGGRQLDTVSATIEALPDVVAIIKQHNERHNVNIQVYTDGGYRSGVDVIKAYSLGANYVFLGRPTVFTLAVNGSDGVVDGYTMIYEELRDVMQLAGFPTLAKIGRSLTKKCTGSHSSSSSGTGSSSSGRKPNVPDGVDGTGRGGLVNIASSLVSGATSMVTSFFGRIPSIGTGGGGSSGGSSGTSGPSSSNDDSCDD